MKEKIKLIDSLSKIDFEIKSLEEKKEKLIRTLEHLTDNKDEQFLIKNWKKLISFYQKYKPETFDHIIVSCFPIKTSVCCCISGQLRFIRLTDLLFLWNNGFVINDKPIVNIIYKNNQEPCVEFISDGIIGSIKITSEEWKKYSDILKNIKASNIHFSKTSVSDLKLKDDS